MHIDNLIFILFCFFIIILIRNLIMAKNNGEFVDYYKRRGNNNKEKIELLVEMSQFPNNTWVSWKFFSIGILLSMFFNYWIIKILEPRVSDIQKLSLIFIISLLIFCQWWNYYNYHYFPRYHYIRANELRNQLI